MILKSFETQIQTVMIYYSFIGLTLDKSSVSLFENIAQGAIPQRMRLGAGSGG